MSPSGGGLPTFLIVAVGISTDGCSLDFDFPASLSHVEYASVVVPLFGNFLKAGIDFPGLENVIICQPERFTLLELHQLRGRTGMCTRFRATLQHTHSLSCEVDMCMVFFPSVMILSPLG